MDKFYISDGAIIALMLVIILTFLARFLIGKYNVGNIITKVHWSKDRFIFLALGILYLIMGFTRVFGLVSTSSEGFYTNFSMGITQIIISLVWITVYLTSKTYIGNKGITALGIRIYIPIEQITGYKIRNGSLVIKRTLRKDISIRFNIKEEKKIKSAVSELGLLEV